MLVAGRAALVWVNQAATVITDVCVVVFAAGLRRHLVAQEPAGSLVPGVAAAGLGLTVREREVLDLVARNLTNSQIAARLGLSGKTVRNHVSNVLAKLQVADRAQATALARHAGLGGAARSEA